MIIVIVIILEIIIVIIRIWVRNIIDVIGNLLCNIIISFKIIMIIMIIISNIFDKNRQGLNNKIGRNNIWMKLEVRLMNKLNKRIISFGEWIDRLKRIKKDNWLNELIVIKVD